MGFRSEKVRELREAKGWSQITLGKEASSTQATISRIEKGESNKRPDRELAKRIARALGVPLADIFEEAPEVEAQAGESPVGVDAYEAALLLCAQDYTVVDFDRAREALREALPLAMDPAEPELVAREWLDAAKTLRLAGRPATPNAIVVRVAMETLRRGAAQSFPPEATGTG